MLDKKDMIRLDELFPNIKGKEIKTRAEFIRVARKVAAAVKRENEYLEKERTDPASTGLFSSATP